ncbi:MAG: histone deacetylase family protein [Dehalococcoidia bacterium]|nr:histone deacetylase family protein [Dehalococcoidia bacterium]
MKVVYHRGYEVVYANDPAARPGRMESIVREVSRRYDLVTPESATTEDVGLVHSSHHIDRVMRLGLAYETAMLAAGGAIMAARLAVAGEPAFALVRPPGHHASRDSSWGFCFFNNLAISIARLRKDGLIRTAAIIDIDLHYGDGTANIFQGTPEVVYFHPEASDRQSFMDQVSHFLRNARADIVAVSAGFDRHERDWGGLLQTEDYRAIGRLVKNFAETACHGRRYGVLEGGYNHGVLGESVRAFLEGMD